MIKNFLLAFCLVLFAFGSSAQQHRFNPDTLLTVVIDSPINIRSHRLNAQDFIDVIVTDTSFYKAFRDMKRYSFTADSRVYTYDKKNKIDGQVYRKMRHEVNGRAFKNQYLAKRDSGNIYKKNGKYELLTVEMFDYIFTNAYNSGFSVGESAPGPNSKDQSYKDKLKTLIFAPGRKIAGLPFISGKTEIFGKDMRQFYTYEFARGKYLDSIPVYRFRVRQKPSTSEGDVMIKELTTIFDMRTFKILGRYVDMRYSNFLFNFDVKMNIELIPYNDELLPAKISYQGNWDVPFHKVERASFLIFQKDYRK